MIRFLTNYCHANLSGRLSFFPLVSIVDFSGHLDEALILMAEGLSLLLLHAKEFHGGFLNLERAGEAFQESFFEGCEAGYGFGL